MGQAKSGVRSQDDRAGTGMHKVRSPRGPGLNCQGWRQEAALRMLMNSLDPEVAEDPRDLVACGATGKVLRDWESYRATVEALKALKNDETLLVGSGRPVEVLRTRQDGPRVIITSLNEEGNWPTSDTLHEPRQPGVHGLGAADPGSWTYVGTQQNLPIAFQVFGAIARTHFRDDLAGKLIVSGGMG